jgi:hypothetical protein
LNNNLAKVLLESDTGIASSEDVQDINMRRKLFSVDCLLPTNAVNVNFILLKMSKTVKY